MHLQNLYLTNLYLTNLYLTNLSRIQELNNFDIHLILKLKLHLSFRNQKFCQLFGVVKPAELIKIRRCRTSEAIKRKFKVTYYPNIFE